MNNSVPVNIADDKFHGLDHDFPFLTLTLFAGALEFEGYGVGNGAWY